MTTSAPPEKSDRHVAKNLNGVKRKPLARHSWQVTKSVTLTTVRVPKAMPSLALIRMVGWADLRVKLWKPYHPHNTMQIRWMKSKVTSFTVLTVAICKLFWHFWFATEFRAINFHLRIKLKSLIYISLKTQKKSNSSFVNNRNLLNWIFRRNHNFSRLLYKFFAFSYDHPTLIIGVGFSLKLSFCEGIRRSHLQFADFGMPSE